MDNDGGDGDPRQPHLLVPPDALLARFATLPSGVVIPHLGDRAYEAGSVPHSVQIVGFDLLGNVRFGEGSLEVVLVGHLQIFSRVLGHVGGWVDAGLARQTVDVETVALGFEGAGLGLFEIGTEEVRRREVMLDPVILILEEGCHGELGFVDSGNDYLGHVAWEVVLFVGGEMFALPTSARFRTLSFATDLLLLLSGSLRTAVGVLRPGRRGGRNPRRGRGTITLLP
mmetsp:Transcript_35278/g.105394  ORF Transcript_35278/g.105394 Transcript_35278/m.105394 type:complete len:227 (-) Transcript_35278:761-1441(-)